MVLSDMELMVQPVAEVARADVDGVVVFLTSAFRADATAARLRDRLQASLRDAPIPILLSGVCSPASRRDLLAAGFPLYAEPGTAVEVLAALARLREGWERADSPPVPPLRLARPEGHDEASLLAYLARQGIPTADTRLVQSPDHAVEAARQIGGRVVLKLAIADLAHKSELGGVIAGIEGDESVRAAWRTLEQRAQAAGVTDRRLGIVVQQQVAGVVEMLLGAHRDPAFGPVVTLGFGGKWVEVIDDVVLRIAPFGEDEARRTIDALRGVRLLRGTRDQPPADLAALARALAAFSRVAAGLDGFASLEVNPFIVGAAGHGAMAVDAKLAASR
jgi:acyl-CoA synthetase (NDP forming)